MTTPAGQPARVIVCVECGGRAHLLQIADPEAPYTEGDWAPYRCEDCLDRFDLEVVAEDLDGSAPDQQTL
ncbi:MAG: hypothetical protein ACKOZL_01350 [Actinomycetes bacterium]